MRGIVIHGLWEPAAKYLAFQWAQPWALYADGTLAPFIGPLRQDGSI